MADNKHVTASALDESSNARSSSPKKHDAYSPMSRNKRQQLDSHGTISFDDSMTELLRKGYKSEGQNPLVGEHGGYKMTDGGNSAQKGSASVHDQNKIAWSRPSNKSDNLQLSSLQFGLTEKHVLLGRGNFHNHPGNIKFRQVVAQFEKVYRATKREEDKREIVQSIYNELKELGMRYVERKKHSQNWTLVNDDSRIKEKIRQLAMTGSKPRHPTVPRRAAAPDALPHASSQPPADESPIRMLLHDELDRMKFILVDKGDDSPSDCSSISSSASFHPPAEMSVATQCRIKE